MGVIETERLLLKLYTEEDAEGLYAYAKNPEVGPPAGWKPHESVEESRTIIREMFMVSGAWAIFWKETGQLIGTIALENDRFRPDARSREMGYSLSRDFWGRGIITEAAKAVIKYGFDVMGLDQISICTGPVNYRSQAVIRKCGFTYEGIIRRAYKIFDGSFRDSLCFSMTREEYIEKYC